jgi:two-component system, cell cycle sensor histidine kinase and response regulator CckA
MNRPEHLQPLYPDQTVVLLAEDEVMVQNIVRLTLQDAGYFVLTAHDGEEALQVSRAYAGPIQILLTDILMPRMTGLELCRHIQVERPQTKILVMSGTHHPGTQFPYLGKPFSPERLREAVRLVLPDGVLFRPSPA